jgi:hypothetical protein
MKTDNVENTLLRATDIENGITTIMAAGTGIAGLAVGSTAVAAGGGAALVGT